MTRMETNPVQRLVRKFGSQARLGVAAGVKQPSVSEWESKGYVPGSRHQRILEWGKAHGIDVSPEDFFRDTTESATTEM